MGILKLLVRATILAFGIFIMANCSQGWSIAGVQLTPADTTINTVFLEVLDTDSVMHYYHQRMYSTQNWCYIHGRFEDVVKAHE
tara:strand:+ start:489 stop:740 length:252 start_codon:yes stop_codon:yes gene_type:complete